MVDAGVHAPPERVWVRRELASIHLARVHTSFADFVAAASRRGRRKAPPRKRTAILAALLAVATPLPALSGPCAGAWLLRRGHERW
jgi:hypothetical protein